MSRPARSQREDSVSMLERSAPEEPRRRRIHPAELKAAIWAGAGVAAYWPIVVALTAPVPLQWPVLIAHLAGMLAGYGILVLPALMSRAPALERGVGADVLARWHGLGGRLVLGLVLIHAAAAVDAWAQARQEDAFTALGDVLALPWLMAATTGTVMLIAVAVISIRAARQRMSYEKWHVVHLMTYLAIALSFIHELAGPDLAGHRVLQIVWALLYTHVFALLFRHRFLTPVRQAMRHRLRVTAVIPEGPGVVSIEVHGRHLEELGAEPGQFFRWRFLTAQNWQTAHPFSLSAPPGQDRLRLTVKALGQGSSSLQRLTPGTRVFAEGPYGAMTAARRTRRDVLLIAGGVGITPMRALFETMPLTPGQDLTLLYRAPNPESLLFRRELDEIAYQRGARVVYLLGPGRDCLSPFALLRQVPQLVDRDVYLCGPAGMADAVRTSLLAAGLPAGNLHEERFAF